MDKMRVYLGLGSNLGKRKENLQKALSLLSQQVGKVLQVSSFYENEAVGFISENLFLNAVAIVESSLLPEDLLSKIQSIEKQLGKHLRASREETYQDRPIDIDILFIEGMIYKSKRLTIPHPLLHERDFVLQPLCEIAPLFVHPILHLSIQELREKIMKSSL